MLGKNYQYCHILAILDSTILLIKTLLLTTLLITLINLALHLSGAPLWPRPLALPTNIKPGWKSLSETSTLANYENP